MAKARCACPAEIIGFCKQLFGRDIQQFQSAFHAGTAQGSIFRFVIAAVQRTGADAVGACLLPGPSSAR